MLGRAMSGVQTMTIGTSLGRGGGQLMSDVREALQALCIQDSIACIVDAEPMHLADMISLRLGLSGRRLVAANGWQLMLWLR
jgi:hypothetical protein